MHTANEPAATSTGTSSNEALQRCAHELLLRSGEIAEDITAAVVARLPRLVSADSAAAIDAVRESTDQNVGAILSTLAFGVPATATEPPLGAHKLLHHTITTGGHITDLLRAYRYGHELLWTHWSDHVGGRLTDARQLAEVLAVSSRHMFTFIDRSCEHLVDSYRTEFGGVPASAGRPPGEVIRELLGDLPMDEGLASSLLGYDVCGHHVSLVLAPIERDGDVRAALDSLAGTAGGTTLSLPVGDGTSWAWFSWPSAPDPAKLAALRGVPLDGVLVGMGRPGRGRLGFRRSHHEAREADRVARLSHRPAAGVVDFTGIQLAGVLCSDPERARPFSTALLGALGRRDETCARLRETLLVYLENGCSRARTATALHVHHKTVSYRLTQAEQLLGRPLTDEVLALGAALLIERTLHGPPD
jgi:hypothetical protein